MKHPKGEHFTGGPFDRRRRTLLQLAGGLAATALWPGSVNSAETALIKKPIPSSGERLPVIGMGTYQTFDVGNDRAARKNLVEVMQTFFNMGGGVIDSSPMYGTSEAVIGDTLVAVSNKDGLFAATKVWTRGRRDGIEQMERSMDRMGVSVMDLMQIHNLVDWRTHMETLKQWKADGKIRYIGITTSHGRDHREFVSIMENESIDFAQFTYSLTNREAEERLLPVARERGIATMINRPYRGGSLFRAVKGKRLPDWAAEFDCRSWGQYFLKFIVSHPAVTCTIPATSKAHHMEDNMGAGFGRLPDAALRQRMIDYFQQI